MKQISIFFFTAFLAISAQAQGVTIGSNNPPDQSAVLDLQSNNLGFLISKLTTAQRNAITNPAIGLQIYNTDTDCLEMYFASGGWKPVQCGCNAFPNAIFNVPQASINNPATLSAPAANMTYNWTFQNGSPATSTNQSAQVTWTNAGTYGITLIVTDSAGCSSTHTDSIIVSLCQPFTHTFTNCGQINNTGPSQNQCNNTYGPGVVTVNGGIQEWTVPTTGTYTIEVWGAEGGANTNGGTKLGGQGARLKGDFSLTAGQVLKILVGQMGENTSDGCAGGGGGGGTFVTLSNNTPLIIAGGGGSASITSSVPAVMNASTSTSGMDGTNNGGSSGRGIGGTNGNGSNTWYINSGTGSGGGGLLTNGGTGTDGPEGGYAFVNGGNGGVQNRGGAGGFGGGGSGRHTGAGGGGYSGGGCGGYTSSCGSCGGAGGGGSFIHANATNAATSNGLYDGSSTHNGGPVQNLNAYNTGHGSVIITRVCP